MAMRSPTFSARKVREWAAYKPLFWTKLRRASYASLVRICVYLTPRFAYYGRSSGC
jgi:hypothetical protein